MRLQKYINEGRSIVISEKDALLSIKKYCSDALNDYKNNKRLYRGVEGNTTNYISINPNKGNPRKSAYAKQNYYTLLLDNLPKWKKYPQRSKSIICTTTNKTAVSYGTPYEVFPYNNPKLAVCPTNDIWFSFNKNIGKGQTLQNFNYSLMMLGKQFLIEIKDTNFTVFKKSLDELSIVAKEHFKDINKLSPCVVSWKPESETLFELYNRLFDPDSNGFKLVNKISNIPQTKYTLGYEVWTNSKSIMVYNDLWGAGGSNTKIMEL